MNKIAFKFIIFFLWLFSLSNAFSVTDLYLLIPMDDQQTNHLKAYGITYYALTLGTKAEWLLNYRGGSFLLEYRSDVWEKASIANVYTEKIYNDERQNIFQTIAENNMGRIELSKAPKIAVYKPPNLTKPWDDAVTLVLSYAEIPFTQLWDEEVINGKLKEYDWLHLHHEDFTAQYGKIGNFYGNESWFVQDVQINTNMAKKLKYESVASLKWDTCKKIMEYVREGGFLFAMCLATDTLDIAIADIGVDIIDESIDGTPIDFDYKSKLDFLNTLVFENFDLIMYPSANEHSTIDISIYGEGISNIPFTFTLYEFSAKVEPIPTMLTQNHTSVIKGFLGATTGFNRSTLKKGVKILSEVKDKKWVNYVHNDYGKGTVTFYAGHDPEDYTHYINDPPTDLNRYPNSAGYRLILNNILFPAAKKKQRITEIYDKEAICYKN